ncbi:hypothetical protein EW906_21615 [Salmonella enterica subsp. enterica serovar Bijlmer]|nr:hypothetical protein [Salmonella enterica subsp. enterica serovar Bijlmer]
MITITKPKRFFMGAFVGALFPKNTNKTNSKQHVNRGYDSESGTTYSENPAYGSEGSHKLSANKSAPYFDRFWQGG